MKRFSSTHMMKTWLLLACNSMSKWELQRKVTTAERKMTAEIWKHFIGVQRKDFQQFGVQEGFTENKTFELNLDCLQEGKDPLKYNLPFSRFLR